MAKEIYPQKEYALGRRVVVDLAQPIDKQFPHLPQFTLARLKNSTLPENIVSLPLPRDTYHNRSLYFRTELSSDREIVKLPPSVPNMEYVLYNTKHTARFAMDYMLDRHSPFGLVYDNMLSSNIQAFTSLDVHNYITMAKNLLVKDGIFALQLADENQGNNTLILEQVSMIFGAPELCRLYQHAQKPTDTGAVWIFRNIDGSNPSGRKEVPEETTIPDYNELLRRITT